MNSEDKGMPNSQQIFTRVLLSALALLIVSTGAIGQYGANETGVRDTIRRIQSRTETLRTDIQNAASSGSLAGYQLNQLNRAVADFTTATDQLDRRLTARRATTADAQLVLDRATTVDGIFQSNRVGSGANRDWQLVRNDLDLLARAYNLNWQPGYGNPGQGSNVSNQQVRQLVQRIDAGTTNFSRSLRQDLSRTNRVGRYSSQEIQDRLNQFESGVADMRNRGGGRQVTPSDVSTLMDQASSLNEVVGERQFSYQTRNSWTTLRGDLDQFASAFGVSTNWSNTGGGGPGYGRQLTGTYQLDSGRSDDAQRIADQATRNLPTTDRQRVYDGLLRRLNPPETLAIDQRGNSVTIASSRAPQINFVADGREQVETTPNGRTVRVTASLSAGRLSITRSGERADDFSVTFERGGDSRQLFVTRSLYSDRLNQPVVVKTVYNKTSDVAQLNLYEGQPGGNVGGDGTSFIVPSGTQINAVLNTDLSTSVLRDNDRFTMTVRSPGQFEAATIEGYVTNVDRSGRISGRAGMTLNFDTIRLRNNGVYRFAGILDSVRVPNGDAVRVDNEGAVRDEQSQTSKTVTRTAVGTAVGAIIGAIAGGGKGAAIGAVVGAGAGAGSVYIQGRDDLQLPAGTEVIVRATGPR